MELNTETTHPELQLIDLLTHPFVTTVLRAGCRILPVCSYVIMSPGGKLGSNIYFKGMRGPKQLINKNLVISTKTEYSGLQECCTPCWGSP